MPRPCLTCGEPGRAYKDGPACDTHAPWALAGHPEPGAAAYGYREVWAPKWGLAPPPRPRARVTDRRTSHAAAASVRGVEETCARIAALLGERGPLTDEELLDEYVDRVHLGVWPPCSPSGLRTRRSEMVSEGRVFDTGRTRRTHSGRRSTVWGLAELADAG